VSDLDDSLDSTRCPSETSVRPRLPVPEQISLSLVGGILSIWLDWLSSQSNLSQFTQAKSCHGLHRATEQISDTLILLATNQFPEVIPRTGSDRRFKVTQCSRCICMNPQDIHTPTFSNVSRSIWRISLSRVP
jgi:hypothetical protein